MHELISILNLTYDNASHSVLFLVGLFGMSLRMVLEIEKLVKSLNERYDALSQKQADYLSMDTSATGSGS